MLRTHQHPYHGTRVTLTHQYSATLTNAETWTRAAFRPVTGRFRCSLRTGSREVFWSFWLKHAILLRIFQNLWTFFGRKCTPIGSIAGNCCAHSSAVMFVGKRVLSAVLKCVSAQICGNLEKTQLLRITCSFLDFALSSAISTWWNPGGTDLELGKRRIKYQYRHKWHYKVLFWDTRYPDILLS